VVDPVAVAITPPAMATTASAVPTASQRLLRGHDRAARSTSLTVKDENAKTGPRLILLIRINRRQLLRYAAIRRFNASRLVGWDAQKARSYVLRHGCEWRVVTRNGVGLVITTDLAANRVDVAVSRGIVRQVSVG